MQWYVYLITISATVFLGQIAVELIKPPLQKILRIRRMALQWMTVFENIPLPKPRELAISSRQIREHDQAVKNVREAQRIFFELGARLFVLSESEPVIRMVMGFLGVDLFAAAYRLTCLSDAFATATSDSAALREEIVTAARYARVTLMRSREYSRDSLAELRLEPMNLGGSR